MSDTDRMRLDIWLWRARFFKTRGAAAAAIEAGDMRVERDGQVRRIEKPSTTVAVGDLLSLTLGPRAGLVRILALPDRRGPAPEAATCYESAGEA
ncbi:MAG: RNA-binding S4 domain-containing protein [Hyphomonadaceae bacterium]